MTHRNSQRRYVIRDGVYFISCKARSAGVFSIARWKTFAAENRGGQRMFSNVRGPTSCLSPTCEAAAFLLIPFTNL